MDKRIFLTALLIMSLFIFTGCTEKTVSENEDKTFQGFIDSIEKDGKINVECSNAIVKKNSEGITDTLARLCSVKIKKDTVILGKDGSSLDKKFLKVGQIVEVVLEKPKDINEDVKSRNVVASEIKILKENNE